jgi:hypothetical protein
MASMDSGTNDASDSKSVTNQKSDTGTSVDCPENTGSVEMVRIPWSIIVQQLNSPNATSFQFQKYVDFYSPSTFLFVYTSNTSQFFSYMRLNFDNDESLKNSKDAIFPTFPWILHVTYIKQTRFRPFPSILRNLVEKGSCFITIYYLFN